MPCSDIMGLLKLLAVFVLKLLWPLVAAVSPLMSTGSESPNDAAANHAYSFWDSSIQIKLCGIEVPTFGLGFLGGSVLYRDQNNKNRVWGHLLVSSPPQKHLF